MPFIVGGAMLGGSLIGGFLSYQASKEASKASSDATKQATAEQARQFDLQRSDSAPWRQAGSNALNLYMGRLSANPNGDALPGYAGGGYGIEDRFNFDPSKIADNPNYQFVRDQSLSAADKVLASQGKFNSGNRVADIMNLANGLASNEIGNEFNRQFQTSNTNYGRGVSQYGLDYQRASDMYGRDQNYLNRLASVANVGQTANQQSATAGANMASNIGTILMNNAGNQANAAYMKYGGINNAVQGGLNNALMYYTMNRYAQPPPPTPTTYMA